MLDIARVVLVHPESNAVDLEFMSDGRRVPGVQVLCDSAASDCGRSDLSEPAGTGYGSETGKGRDVFAVIGWMEEFPVVLGFLFPQVSECLFADKNRRIDRHASDVYSTIDADGNAEFHHPSGAYVRFGTSPAHEDLTGKDYDKKWAIRRNTDKPVHIHVEQAGGVAAVNIAPSGAISADSAVSIVLSSPSNTINGPLAVNGPVTVSEDLTAGGISSMHHTHGDPQGGSVGQPQ